MSFFLLLCPLVQFWFYRLSLDSSVLIMTELRPGRPWNLGSIIGRDKRVSPLCSVHTGVQARLTYCPLHGGLYHQDQRRRSVRLLTTHLQLMLSLKYVELHLLFSLCVTGLCWSKHRTSVYWRHLSWYKLSKSLPRINPLWVITLKIMFLLVYLSFTTQKRHPNPFSTVSLLTF